MRSFKEFDERKLKALLKDKAWTNPFLRTFNVNVKAIRVAGSVREELLEEGGTYLINDSILVEQDEYVKYYSSIERRIHLAMLSPGGSHLLLWILNTIKYGDEIIWINRHRYMQERGVNRKEAYENAVESLIENNVLLKTPKYVDLFFINPFFFFKGNRIKKYAETNVKVVEI